MCEIVYCQTWRATRPLRAFTDWRNLIEMIRDISEERLGLSPQAIYRLLQAMPLKRL